MHDNFITMILQSLHREKTQSSEIAQANEFTISDSRAQKPANQEVAATDYFTFPALAHQGPCAAETREDRDRFRPAVGGSLLLAPGVESLRPVHRAAASKR